MKTRRIAACLLLLVSMMFSVAGWTQAPAPGNTPPPPPSGASAAPRPAQNGTSNDPSETKRLVQEIMTARIARELALDDAQTVLMLKRFTQYRAQLDAFRKERQELVKDLRASVTAKESDEQIEAKLKALKAHDLKISDYKKSLYESASEGLSVSQRAKLYIFLGDFENDMRKLAQKAREQSGQRLNRQAAPPDGPPTPGMGQGGRNRMKAPAPSEPAIPPTPAAPSAPPEPAGK